MSEHDQDIRVFMSSVERRGPWTVPPELDVRVRFGNLELDLREATLAPGTTTVRVHCSFGNVEIIVPEGLVVETYVASLAANVSNASLAEPAPAEPPAFGAYRSGPEPKRLRIVGSGQGSATARCSRSRPARPARTPHTASITSATAVIASFATSAGSTSMRSASCGCARSIARAGCRGG